MANLAIGKTEVKEVVKVLDQDHETLEDAAKAALARAWELYEAKAKHVVVGQVKFDGGYLSPEDGRASKVCLGPYGTDKQAVSAGESLAYSNASGAELVWWVLPIHHGTPHEWHTARKQARAALEVDGPTAAEKVAAAANERYEKESA